MSKRQARIQAAKARSGEETEQLRLAERSKPRSEVAVFTPSHLYGLRSNWSHRQVTEITPENPEATQ